MYRQSGHEIMEAGRRLLDDRLRRMEREGLQPLTFHSIPAYATPRAHRSLRSCHRPALKTRPLHAPPKDTGAYVPELSARLEDDLNLTDGARRCARKIAEYTYRQNRAGRCARITVTYLMQALGKSRRTVQRYLRQLENAGYIASTVLKAQTRMCAGLIIQLLAPLFTRHHAAKWPAKLMKPDASQESQNQSHLFIYEQIPLTLWALHCMDGVWRSFNRHYPPGTLPTG